MKTRMLAAVALIAAAAASAHGEVNAGGGMSFETGRPPIFPVIPQLFIEGIYRVAPWQTFGLALSVAAAPLQNSSFDNGKPAGPLLCFGVDASYVFPRLGPVEPSVLVGGWGFHDYHNRVNGVTAETGLGAALRMGNLVLKSRVLYRFYSSTGTGGAPDPLGLISIAMLAGITLGAPG